MQSSMCVAATVDTKEMGIGFHKVIHLVLLRM